ncbi:hypothetical protein [Marivita sp. GX14005]|uniref:type III secretion apparatus assembly protein SctX n=1 Tax=Marivita sp. GX14005 TaxID=2942276 RepID=UPI002018E8DA|nr:hypothetical protein [Marivita sp. GX14005]MCL3883321.1 hypothetical protein [Marivita sp. GX14005]
MAICPTSRATRHFRDADLGVAGIHRWRVEDEVHLPGGPASAPGFLPQERPLDAVLRRDTLDERLVDHMVPAQIDPELLSPPVMTRTRETLAGKLALAADAGGGSTLDHAAMLLQEEVLLDEDVRAALSALLKG